VRRVYSQRPHRRQIGLALRDVLAQYMVHHPTMFWQRVAGLWHGQTGTTHVGVRQAHAFGE